MKPRIVREYGVPSTVLNLLSEDYHGPAYLALPWPEDCPWTPEQVMAACERNKRALLGLPELELGDWIVYAQADGRARRKYVTLTPEFMAEPKKCEHSVRRSDWGNGYATCAECGAGLSDRRKGERRKGERRWVTECRGGRRHDGFNKHHRTGKDRRKP